MKTILGMKHATTFTALFLTFLTFTWTALAQSGDGYDLSWWTVDGGGGTSSGDGYTLTGTIGQPDADLLNGGSCTLVGGFWGSGGPASGSDVNNIYLPLILRE